MNSESSGRDDHILNSCTTRRRDRRSRSARRGRADPRTAVVDRETGRARAVPALARPARSTCRTNGRKFACLAPRSDISLAMILVTGGAGFVGSNLAVSLAHRHPDWEVVAFDSLHRKGSELNLPRLKEVGVRFVRGDVREPDQLEAIGPITALVECSAEPSVTSAIEGGTGFVPHELTRAYNCLELARQRDAYLVFSPPAACTRSRGSTRLPTPSGNPLRALRYAAGARGLRGRDLGGFSMLGLAPSTGQRSSPQSSDPGVSGDVRPASRPSTAAG